MTLILDGFLLMVGAVAAYVVLHVLGWAAFIVLAMVSKD